MHEPFSVLMPLSCRFLLTANCALRFRFRMQFPIWILFNNIEIAIKFKVNKINFTFQLPNSTWGHLMRQCCSIRRKSCMLDKLARCCFDCFRLVLLGIKSTLSVSGKEGVLDASLLPNISGNYCIKLSQIYNSFINWILKFKVPSISTLGTLDSHSLRYSPWLYYDSVNAGTLRLALLIFCYF